MQVAQEDFAEKLVALVERIYETGLYSDVDVRCDSQVFKAHRFVLAVHTDFWGDLDNLKEISLDDVDYSTGRALLDYVYTGKMADEWGYTFLLKLLVVAANFRFSSLRLRCVEALSSELDSNNCIPIYEAAHRLQESELKTKAAGYIGSNWTQFGKEHFKEVDCQLLLDLFSKHSKYPLHSIVNTERRDVLELYLEGIEQPEDLNNPDESGLLPLDVAFDTRNLDIAKVLCDSGADVNENDPQGKCFMSKAAERGDVDVLHFLVKRGANVNYTNELTGRTFLHDLASSTLARQEIVDWAKDNIPSFDINAQDTRGRTPLYVAVRQKNSQIVDLILSHHDVDVNIKDAEDHSPLELALFSNDDSDIASKLITRGADLNLIDEEGNTLLHRAVLAEQLKLIRFLLLKKVDVDKANAKGQTSLHMLLSNFPSRVSRESPKVDALQLILKGGGNPSLLDVVTGLTPLHTSIHLQPFILEIVLKECKDASGNSPLWLALTASNFEAARMLVKAGADVNEVSDDKDSLLIRAVRERRDDVVDFLITNNADVNLCSKDGCSCLTLAVKNGLTSTADTLCRLGANINGRDSDNNVPVWVALKNQDYATAQVLVSHGCDLEAWSFHNGVEETLLHRAINEGENKMAIFLIKSGADTNAVQKFADETKTTLNTPLHLSVINELLEISGALISNLKCKIDAQDIDGNTVAHLAVSRQDKDTLDLILSHPNANPLTLRNANDLTPLGIAMKLKYDKAAEAICHRLPHAALQVDVNGENLLHAAVKGNDFEAVLFLLGLQIDVNIPTENNTKIYPIHLSASHGNELIMRNLILAGSDVNAIDSAGRTALHYAAVADRSEHCKILLENGADPNQSDHEGNNALHTAVLNGAVQAAQTLLLESDVNPLGVNTLKRNIVHLCAAVPGLTAAELFQTIIEIHPNFPLENGDVSGNTAFLLSFINGNSDLCRLMLKYGVCMGACNSSGESAFHLQGLTSSLYNLLNNLDREPRWAEGDFCSDCEAKFTLTMRKHHCRHCGRLVCAKCSENQMPILKYNLAKNVRVCHVCYSVLTTGVDEKVENRLLADISA